MTAPPAERDGTGQSVLSMAEQHDLLARRLSRRTVLRGGAIGLGAAMLGPTLVGCSQNNTVQSRTGPSTILESGPEAVFGRRGAPGGRHLSFGPDPTTQMRVAWQVASVVQEPFIRIGSTDGELDRPIPAQLRALPTQVPDLGATYVQYYVHAELDGLTPDTDYVYALGHRGYSDAQWLKASVATFRTAPSITHTAAPFTFTAFGDQGTNSQGVTNMALVSAQQPAFHLLAGDIAYADGTGRGDPPAPAQDEDHDQFDPLLWDRYLAQIDRVASTVPWMVAAGNHDMEAAYSANGYGGLQERFLFPGNGPQMCPAVYSFVYGNVGVVSLDANDLSFEIPRQPRLLRWRADGLARQGTGRAQEERSCRLHRGLLPSVCVLHRARARLRRGHPQGLDPALRPLSSRPRDQWTQPSVRAHGSATREQGLDAGARGIDDPTRDRWDDLSDRWRRWSRCRVLPGGTELCRPRIIDR